MPATSMTGYSWWPCYVSQWDRRSAHRRRPSLCSAAPARSPLLTASEIPFGNFDFKTSDSQLNVGDLALEGDRLERLLCDRAVQCKSFHLQKKKKKEEAKIYAPPRRYPCCLCEAYCTFMFVRWWFIKDEGMWFRGIRLSGQLLSFCLLESCGNLDRIVHADIVGGGDACVFVWWPLWWDKNEK